MRARSMKMVLVRWRDVAVLDSSVNFTKHTLDGMSLLRSLQPVV